MKTYTKEEKKAYFLNLRNRWKAAKEHADIDEINAIINNHGLKISASGYAFVALQMKAQHLDGIPYLDMKTYKGWKDNGYQVCKGEHSTADGISWVSTKKDDDGNDDDDRKYLMPHLYKLFHRTQVQEQH